MKRIPISVLDQSPVCSGRTPVEAISETLALARHCEQWGYHRYWVSEHHATLGLAGSSPEVLLARLGAETKSMRIGSGGVMLPHYSPYKVAENFKLLETLYPGRIDLGVGRAPGSSPYIAAALAYGSNIGAEYFPQMVADLDALLRDAPPLTPGLEKARAMPCVDSPPALWMLGSSEDSAGLAGKMGLPYSVAHFINPHIREDIFEIYRRQFTPGAVAGEPYTCLTVFMICADSEEEAKKMARCRDLWFLRRGKSLYGTPYPSVEEAEQYHYTPQEEMFLQTHFRPPVLGRPEQVQQELRAMAERFAADELMIVSITHDFEARCRSHRLLAEAWY